MSQDDFIFESQEMKKVRELAVQFAGYDCPVLITGESGSGKEVTANFIRDNSPRREEIFLRVNVSSLSENLFASEMFGHEKGSFTGADKKRRGYFTAAEGGTLFLDEIGYLPFSSQKFLLRALENKEIIPVGSEIPKTTDVRIIAASSCDFQEKIKRGEFDLALFHRLNVAPINIPPLRERTGDILPLAKYFLKRKSAEFRMACPVFSSETKKMLLAKKWPGNVRELKNAVERALMISRREEILGPELFSFSVENNPPAEIRLNDNNPPKKTGSLERIFSMTKVLFDTLQEGKPIDIHEASKNFRSALVLEAMENCFPDLDQVPERLGISKGEFLAIIGNLVLENSKNHTDEEDEEEKQSLISAIEESGGILSIAGKILGHPYQWVQYKVAKYQLKELVTEIKRKKQS